MTVPVASGLVVYSEITQKELCHVLLKAGILQSLDIKGSGGWDNLGMSSF